MKNLKLRIEDMDCEDCAISIENLLRMRDLVESVKIDYEGKAGTIDFDETKTTKQKIIKAITEAGYEAIKVE
jgi:copper chaperone CopZ